MSGEELCVAQVKSSTEIDGLTTLKITQRPIEKEGKKGAKYGRTKKY